MVVGGFDNIERFFRKLDSTLFFFARKNPDGLQLWSSDGTELGTAAVTDFAVEDGIGVDDDNPEDFIAASGRLYFFMDHKDYGEELWTSDGTQSGTVLLKDINSRPGDSDADDMLAVNGTVYFEADDDVHGEEFWTTRGTPASTKMLLDSIPGVVGLDPDELCLIGDILYFEGEDGVYQDELWKMNVGELCSVIKTSGGKVAVFCL